MTSTRPLTRRQSAFCDEVLAAADFNFAAAARRAGYSARRARQSAHDLLHDPRIQARIAAIVDQRRNRTEVDQDEVVEEFRRVAFARITDFVSWDATSVRFVPSDQLREESKSAVKKIKAKHRIHMNDDGTTDETLELDIELHAKDPALKALAAHLGMKLGTTGGGVFGDGIGTPDNPFIIQVVRE
ncbi:MAG TPA: terminase small subunit [Longimicrobiales bacterium]|nr:terminase small subunit [Longimicrobiales bacterium]